MYIMLTYMYTLYINIYTYITHMYMYIHVRIHEYTKREKDEPHSATQHKTCDNFWKMSCTQLGLEPTTSGCDAVPYTELRLPRLYMCINNVHVHVQYIYLWMCTQYIHKPTKYAHLIVGSGSFLSDLFTDSLWEVPQSLVVLLLSWLPRGVGLCTSATLSTVCIEIKRASSLSCD